MMCHVLEVSRSSYYVWKKNPQGKRAIRTREIGKKIQGIYFEANGRYGSPRITKELEEQGMKLSRRTVAKYMKRMGLKSRLSRKYKATTDSSHQEPVAENLLNRDFESQTPGTKCVSDITYLHTREGFLYLTRL